MQTILLVEDELELARVVARELSGAGYRVEHVAGGEAALRCFAQGPPDLVLLDWMLPGVDGLEVLRWLHWPGIQEKGSCGYGYSSRDL